MTPTALCVAVTRDNNHALAASGVLMKKEILAAVLILMFVGCSRDAQVSRTQAEGAARFESHFVRQNFDELPTLAPMLASTSPAVVSVAVQGKLALQENPLLDDPFFRKFFDLPDASNDHGPVFERFQAAGSGVVIDSAQGYLITNHHLVDRAEKIQVVLNDRRRLDATLIGSDAQTDIAILRVKADGLHAISLGDSKTLQVGDFVVAIGNPFGLSQTATFGMVSALGRTRLGIESYEDFIQTDASINPGNSGGALVDVKGRLVGINAAIISQSGGSVGVGFAVPIDMAKGVADQLIATGRVSRGALGVTVQDLTEDLARAMGLNVTKGAVVSQVQPESAAAKAGIRERDVITAVNDESVLDASHLRNSIGKLKPGAVVHLSLRRDSRERSVMVKLDPLSAPRHTAATLPLLDHPLSGMTLGPIPRGAGKSSGAYLENVAPGSEAEAAGLQEGDIITAIGSNAVTSPEDVVHAIRARKQGLPLLLRVLRRDEVLFVALN